MLPNDTTQPPDALVLSESESLLLSKAKRSRKSKLIAESSGALLESKPLDQAVYPRLSTHWRNRSRRVWNT